MLRLNVMNVWEFCLINSNLYLHSVMFTAVYLGAKHGTNTVTDIILTMKERKLLWVK